MSVYTITYEESNGTATKKRKDNNGPDATMTVEAEKKEEAFEKWADVLITRWSEKRREPFTAKIEGKKLFITPMEEVNHDLPVKSMVKAVYKMKTCSVSK